MNGYAAPFASMSPDLIERYPSAASIEHASVTAAKLAETSDGDSSSPMWTLRLTLPDRKRAFDLRTPPGHLAATLRQAYGQRFCG